MSVQDVLRVLKAQWVVALIVFLLTLASTVAFTSASTPQYASTGQIFVTAESTQETNAYQGDLFAQQRVQSYAVLARGDRLASAVIDRLDLSVTPQSIASRITTSVPTGTALLNITVTDASPRQAQRLADAATEEFIRLVGRYESTGEGSARVQLIVSESAQLPGHPVTPRPLLNAAVGVVLGAVLAVIAALIRQVRRPRDEAGSHGTVRA